LLHFSLFFHNESIIITTKRKGDKNNNLYRYYIFGKFNNEFNNIICNSNNIKNKA